MNSVPMQSVVGAKLLKPAAAKKFRRRLLACALSLAFAAFPTMGSANHSWGDYHWARTSVSFNVELGNNVSGAWLNDPINSENHLNTTSFDWSISTVLDTTIVQGGTTPRRCRATVGRVEVCNEKYGKNGWLGVAQIWLSGSHITQGTAKLNDTYFNTSKYNKPEWRNLVMCQEVGHTLGLDHQDENFNNQNLGTCMDYTSNPLGPPNNEHPNKHDYDELVTIYKHLDSFATVADATNANLMPRAMTDFDYTERSQWGKLVRSSKDGLLETYSLDFGRGFKLITFVIWAEGQGRGR